MPKDVDGTPLHGGTRAPGPAQDTPPPIATRGWRRTLEQTAHLSPASLTNWEDVYAARFAATKAEAESDDFKAGLDAADHILKDFIRSELFRRAFTPVKEPIMYRGQQVNEKLVYDNRLLFALGVRYLKDELHLSSKMEVSAPTGIRFVFDAGETRDDEPELVAEDGDYSEIDTHELEPGQDN